MPAPEDGPGHTFADPETGKTVERETDPTAVDEDGVEAEPHTFEDPKTGDRVEVEARGPRQIAEGVMTASANLDTGLAAAQEAAMQEEVRKCYAEGLASKPKEMSARIAAAAERVSDEWNANASSMSAQGVNPMPTVHSEGLEDDGSNGRDD